MVDAERSMPENVKDVKSAYGEDHVTPCPDIDAKVTQIKKVCSGNQDLHLLIDLATSVGGLCNDDLRRVACTCH